jgi:hypothetical protein
VSAGRRRRIDKGQQRILTKQLALLRVTRPELSPDALR